MRDKNGRTILHLSVCVDGLEELFDALTSCDCIKLQMIRANGEMASFFDSFSENSAWREQKSIISDRPEIVAAEAGSLASLLLVQDCEGFSALHLAAIFGKADIARTLSRLGGPLLVGLQEANGFTCLHCAAMRDMAEVATAIIQGVAEVPDAASVICAVNKEGVTALQLAAYKGSLQTAKEMTDLVESARCHSVRRLAGHLLEYSNADGMSALHFAASSGRTDIVRMLVRAASVWDGSIDEGVAAALSDDHQTAATPNRTGEHRLPQTIFLQTTEGWTALHLAVGRGHIETAAALAELGGADLALKSDDEGRTCLHVGAVRGRASCIRAVLATCGSVWSTNLAAAKDQDGWTFLHYAAAQRVDETVVSALFSDCLDDSISMVGVALADQVTWAQTVLPMQTSDGLTALHVACARGNAEAARALATKGGAAIVATRDSDGYTCLHYAASRDHSAAVAAVVKCIGSEPGAAAGICARSQGGRTCLHICAHSGHTGTVSAIVSLAVASSDYWRRFGHELLSTADDEGMTPLHFAASAGHAECVRLILAALLAGLRAASHVAESTWGEMEAHAPWGHNDEQSGEQVQVLRQELLLLKESSGWSPLHLAALHGRAEVVEILTGHGGMGAVTQTDADGRTALTLASYHGHTAVAAHLLRWVKAHCLFDDNWAEQICISDNAGRTWLHWAAARGHAETCRELLQVIRELAGTVERKVNTLLEKQDGQCLTCLHCACLAGHSRTARALTEAGGANFLLLNSQNGGSALGLARQNLTVLEYSELLNECKAGASEATRGMREEKALAAMMARHRRLGAESPLMSLDENLLALLVVRPFLEFPDLILPDDA